MWNAWQNCPIRGEGGCGICILTLIPCWLRSEPNLAPCTAELCLVKPTAVVPGKALRREVEICKCLRFQMVFNIVAGELRQSVEIHGRASVTSVTHLCPPNTHTHYLWICCLTTISTFLYFLIYHIYIFVCLFMFAFTRKHVNFIKTRFLCFLFTVTF